MVLCFSFLLGLSVTTTKKNAALTYDAQTSDELAQSNAGPTASCGKELLVVLVVAHVLLLRDGWLKRKRERGWCGWFCSIHSFL